MRDRETLMGRNTVNSGRRYGTGEKAGHYEGFAPMNLSPLE
jgi:hypothetical protein